MSMTGVEAIAAERKRQIEKEGWSESHDRQHSFGELILAAVCYALPADCREEIQLIEGNVPKAWPWDIVFWKPTPNDRKREIVKAGALLAAEYDRLVAEEAQP